MKRISFIRIIARAQFAVGGKPDGGRRAQNTIPGGMGN